MTYSTVANRLADFRKVTAGANSGTLQPAACQTVRNVLGV